MSWLCLSRSHSRIIAPSWECWYCQLANWRRSRHRRTRNYDRPGTASCYRGWTAAAFRLWWRRHWKSGRQWRYNRLLWVLGSLILRWRLVTLLWLIILLFKKWCPYYDLDGTLVDSCAHDYLLLSWTNCSTRIRQEGSCRWNRILHGMHWRRILQFRCAKLVRHHVCLRWYVGTSLPHGSFLPLRLIHQRDGILHWTFSLQFLDSCLSLYFMDSYTDDHTG